MGNIKKVMIADDDPGIVDSLSMMLEFEGYEVSSTLNGATLLNMDKNLPDLLLLDIWMSGIDGRDICRQLKQQPHTSHLPILMISASKDIQGSAPQAGADDFLAKPFEMDELLQKIQQTIFRLPGTD
jgi:CheY-like chemotaxis protein